VPTDLSTGIETLKEKLLTMASYSEAAVNHAVKALMKRDDDLARQTREDDEIIDRLEMEIDAVSADLLTAQPDLFAIRFIIMAMKIAHDLERVGDEATTISRRCLELSREPVLPQVNEIPVIGRLALQMLKESLDAFVQQEPLKARDIIRSDDQVDDLNKRLRSELERIMIGNPASVPRCLNLMVISKSLERVADHATNIAEMVVYLYEGRDIRHSS
jgi:phosphate transport system protein